jgi:hypothetical protein
MTTDELERELKTRAEPQADDEQLRLAVRASLDEHLGRLPSRRRRTGLALGSAALAAATLAAAIVALTGTGGSSSANAAVLAHVAHAISTPADIIVHVRETAVQRDGTPVAAEWWQETDAPYAIRLIKGPVGQEVESASDGTTSSQYDSATNTIYQQPDSKSPTLIDPIESVRAALTSGTAQVAGTVTIDGRSLYKIELSNGVVGYFDRTSYRPVYLDNPQRDGSVVRAEVTTYEELALTLVNEKLLSVAAQHPGARVQTGQAPAPAKEPGSSKQD